MASILATRDGGKIYFFSMATSFTAAALGAEYCEICSDVDGVLTADPRIEPQARVHRALSVHEEVRLTADLGLGGMSLFSVIIAIFVGVKTATEGGIVLNPLCIRRCSGVALNLHGIRIRTVKAR